MATIVKMPKLGLTMTEGLIVKWIKKEGERVEKGEPLLEIQTDKVNLEEEAPASGILKKILYEEGETLPILTPIAVIAEAGEELSYLENTDHSEEITESSEYNLQEKKQSEKTACMNKTDTNNPSIGKFGKIKASPAAKRIAKENKIDLYKIIGSGKNSRITAGDVMKFIETSENLFKSADEILDELPLIGMRKVIADRMKKSVNESHHFYLTVEVDMTSIISLRKELNLTIEDNRKKISFNDLLIKVAAKALQNHRIINSRVCGDKIKLLKQINIGLAVALDNGLIVPVIKYADKKSLVEIAQETKALIDKAKNNKLAPEELTGGTFTISNLGMYDIIEFVAIINQPESAILAIGKIQDRPVVTSERKIEIRPMMNITLSSDHRIIDGAEGAKFLQTLKNILENPLSLLY